MENKERLKDILSATSMKLIDIIDDIDSVDNTDNSINITLLNGDEYRIVFTNPNLNCITWCVEDFRYKAEDLEGDLWEMYYDESKFPEALHAMIRQHDSTIGITWDTVAMYLNDFCRIEGEDEIEGVNDIEYEED